MTHFYKAYNLYIQSTFPLLELLTVPSAPDSIDVQVNTAEEAYPALDSTHPVQIVPDGVVYRLYPIGVLYIRRGDRIVLQLIPEAEPALASDLIVNHGMALILHQRGNFVLHASSAEVEGGAVAFAGESGFGKSTTAAVFDQHGYHVLSDDVVAVNLRGSMPMVLPAFPQVKLLPDAVVSLYGEPDALPLQFEDGRKRVYRAHGEFPQAPQPLKAIYLLDRGDCTQIEPVTPRQALIEMFRHSYVARQVRQFGVDLLKGTETEGQHLLNMAELVNAVPIRRLRRCFAPGELDALPELIHDDLATL